MRLFIYIASMSLLCSQLIAQKDTSSIHLGEVSITVDSLQKKSYSNIIYYEFSEEEIQNSVYSNLGAMVNTISNITLKDYGGIGGLKTISVRGFSAVHNGVLINNIPISNSQTGAIDLGGYRTDNIYKMSFYLGSTNEILFPAKSNAYVSVINIIPRELKDNIKKLNVLVSAGIGSFSTIEPFIAINSKYGKKGFIGFNFRYLQSKGDYPYSHDYGQGTIEGKRENSQVKNYQMNLGGKQGLKKGKMEYRASFSDANKQLPGAVIYFDSSKAEQKLLDTKFDAQLNYKFKNEKWSALAFANYSYVQTQYTDPNFLNSTGGINDSYWMNNYYFGTTFSLHPFIKFTILMGVDETFTTLTSTKSTINNTLRSDLKGLIGLNYSFWRMKIKANALLSYIRDENSGSTTFETAKVNPFISIGIFPIKKSLFNIRFYYKNSLRPPTMNELYYNQIIKNIEPESAHQFNLGLSYKKLDWGFLNHLTVGVDFYKNLVRNKIILIPTQNLFIWSVQNIGKTDITGVDFNFSFKTKEFKYFILSLDVKYSLLIAQDLTDPNTKTYKNQLPYIPKDNFTASFSLELLGFGLSWSMNYGGTRYALGENIEANKLENFLINDLSFYYKYNFKDNKNSLKIKIDIRNLLNEQYMLIKSFPMPGINYNVKLVYEFNH